MYDDGYKTIKQVMDELNVSRSTISRVINGSLKDSLEPHTKIIGKFKAVSPEGVRLIVESLKNIPATEDGDVDVTANEKASEKISENTSESTPKSIVDEKVTANPDDSAAATATGSGQDTTALMDLIKSLTNQLEAERAHSRELIIRGHEQADKILEQSDKILSLASELAELNKNNQYLLRYEQSKANPSLLTANDGETQDFETNKKKGLMARLFRR